MTEEKQRAIARERVGLLWKLAKGNVERSVDSGDFQFVCFTHINQERGSGFFLCFTKESLRFGDADFERGGGVLSHGGEEEFGSEDVGK